MDDQLDHVNGQVRHQCTLRRREMPLLLREPRTTARNCFSCSMRPSSESNSCASRSPALVRTNQVSFRDEDFMTRSLPTARRRVSSTEGSYLTGTSSGSCRPSLHRMKVSRAASVLEAETRACSMSAVARCCRHRLKIRQRKETRQAILRSPGIGVGRSEEKETRPEPCWKRTRTSDPLPVIAHAVGSRGNASASLRWQTTTRCQRRVRVTSVPAFACLA